MKRLLSTFAIAFLALTANSCFQEDYLDPPIPENKDFDSSILEVKVSGRHPQLFAKVNFISGGVATKSSSGNYYSAGTESLGDLIDISKLKTSVIGDYEVTEIPFKSNSFCNYALMTESEEIKDIRDVVSQVQIFLVHWKSLTSGEEIAYVVTMIPDDCFSLSLHPDYSFLNDMDWFSGAILFSDLLGNHVDTYITAPDVMGHAILLDESLAGIVPEECLSYQLALQSPGSKAYYWDNWSSNSLGLVVMLDGGGGGSGYEDDFGWFDELEASYCVASRTSNSVFVTYQDWDEPEMGNDYLDSKTLERNRLLQNVKGDKGGGTRDRDSEQVNEKIRVGGKALVVKGKKKDVTSFKNKTEAGFKLSIIKTLASKIDTEAVTIEVVESLKDDNGNNIIALTSPSGEIRIEASADNGTIFEELLHVYQFQTEGSQWKNGDKEFEAKVFCALLLFQYSENCKLEFNFINDATSLGPFYYFYTNPSEDTYNAALIKMRNSIGYGEENYPVSSISNDFSFEDTVKHIKGLISK